MALSSLSVLITAALNTDEWAGLRGAASAVFAMIAVVNDAFI